MAILSEEQSLVLQLLSKTMLAKSFYFTGGTALAHFYLKHRRSEDLDFFNQEEFDPQVIVATLKSLQKKLKYKSIDFQNSFNRNLYFLKFENGNVLKLEFTYYPFTQVEKPSIKNGLLVDSPVDIAVNKLFTISQKPRGRDYFDLYCLIEKYKLEDLRTMAKKKFDWHIDPLHLASRLYEVALHLDDPILVKKISKKEIIHFFQALSLQLKGEIIVG